MWFWMNKAIQTNKGTLLAWILNFCCLDHDDVTWDSSKGESYGEQEEREEKMKQGGFREKWKELEVLGVKNHRSCFGIA